MSWRIATLSSILVLLPPADIYGAESFKPDAYSFLLKGYLEEDRSILTKISWSALSPYAATLLADGSAYYLGMALLGEEAEIPSASFFELSIRTESTPWQDESFKEIVAIYRKNSEWQALENISLQKLQRTPANALALWAYAESLWEQGKYNETQKALDALPSAENYSYASRIRQGAARAVTSRYLNGPSWPQLYEAIIWNEEANSSHNYLSRSLTDNASLNRLEALSRGVLRFRAELAAGRNLVAYQEIAPYLQNDRLYRYAGFWNDLVRVFARTRRYREGEQVLAPRLRGLNGWLGSTAWAAMGRLRSTSGNYSGSKTAFLAAARFLETPLDIERLKVQAADAGFDLNFQEGFQVLQEASWVSPVVWTNLLQSQVAKAVRDKRWANVVQLYKRYGSRVVANERMGWEWTLIRAAKGGFIDWNASGLPSSPEALLRQIAGVGGISYPVLMARSSLGLPAVEVMEVGRWPQSQVPEDPFIWGFLRFGLPELVYERLDTTAAVLDWRLIRTLILELERQKKFLPALRLISRLSQRSDFSRGMSEWKTLYPKAYWEEVELISTKENIEPWVFLSLIREESHFDAKVKSHVGATGLSQLMPATFQEQSRRMRLTDPDIFDPFTNLSIGGNYLGMRLRQLEHPAKALMAYNAGAHRVTVWNDFFLDYPDELLTEMVPFLETRNYVKKIMATRIIYQNLYGDGDSLAAVKTIYPNFRP